MLYSHYFLAGCVGTSLQGEYGDHYDFHGFPYVYCCLSQLLSPVSYCMTYIADLHENLSVCQPHADPKLLVRRDLSRKVPVVRHHPPLHTGCLVCHSVTGMGGQGVDV